jgi:SET domain
MIQIFNFQVADVVSLAPYAVMRRDGAFLLIAAKAVDENEQLFRIEGLEVTTPSFASVQVGPNLHIDMEPQIDLTGQMDLYPWRFMNHSCDANCVILDRAVYAQRRIDPGDELTFDYNSTEYDMAEPFECACGSPKCVQTIAGSRHQTCSTAGRNASDSF